MNNLIVIITLTQEICFDNYQTFMCREKNISFTQGSIIKIANIDCKILKELPGKLYEISIETSMVEKFANNLKWSIDDYLEILVDIEDDGNECNFYINKINFYHSLLIQYLFEHNLCECHTCKDYINLDKEHIEYGDKHFCSHDHQKVHQHSLDYRI